MANGGRELDDESIGDLFGRLIDDGSNLFRAEADLQWQVARSRLAEARLAMVLVALGLLLVMSSVVGLIVGCVLALTPLIGPVAAGLVVTLFTLALAGLLFWLAVKRVQAAAALRRAADRERPR